MKDLILNLFAYDSKLSFGDINSKLKVRSNHLSYWLNKLTKQNLLKKEGQRYSLTEDSEHLIPYLSSNKSNLPVVLIEIRNGRSVFLDKRKKRPYKNLLSLPGGRILIGESIEQAAKRIMKTKFNVEIYKISLKNIFLEHIKKNKKIIYSFSLFLVKAAPIQGLELTNIQKKKSQIIPSDYKMLTHKENMNKKIKTIVSNYK